MITQIRPALALLALLSLLTGAAYPAFVTLVAQVVFPRQANGSLLPGSAGSELIGQPFDDPSYFWARPSATAPVPYNAAASTGSNLGPTNPALLSAVEERIAALRKSGVDAQQPVPVDLVTASGSGLDPHISPAAAHFQVSRVARDRNVDTDTIARLVDEHTEGRTWGLLGEPRVNVLKLNLALDKLTSARK